MSDDSNPNESYQQFFMDILLSRIKSEDFDQKTLAACGLCLSRDARALTALEREAFRHSYLYPYVAAAAASDKTCKDLAPAIDPVTKLIEGLASSDFWVHELAISGLSQSRDPRASAALKQALFQGTGGHKQVAAALADKLGPADLPDIIQAVQNPGLGAETAMGMRIILPSSGLGPALAPILKALLSDTAYPRKDLILQILVNVDREAGREAMMSLVSHSDDKVRETIAFHLSYYEVEQVIQPLLSLLNDISWRVRKSTALSMGAWGDQVGDRIFNLLLPLLADASRRVRFCAALSLVRVGREKTLPYLEKMKAERKLLGKPLKVVMQSATQKHGG